MNEKKIRRAIEIAYALFYKKNGRNFHCSFIFNKNRIISIGVNDYNKTNPITRKLIYKNSLGQIYNPGIHSEVSAILKIQNDDFSSYNLLNLRIDNNMKLAHCSPCYGCLQLLNMLNFKAIYYSDNHGQIREFSH